MIGRAWLLCTLFVLVTAAMVVRLFQLQILQGAYYASDVEQSRLVVEHLPALRGRILDRHGSPLADNRSVYDLAVVLARLELPARERLRVPVYELTSEGLEHLLAELAARTLRSTEHLREQLLHELEAFPAVGLARGQSRERRPGREAPTLLALPRSALIAAGDDAVETVDDREGSMALAATGLLYDHPRPALERELSEHLGERVLLLTAGNLAGVAAFLGERFDAPAALVESLLEPFAPEVKVPAPQATEGEPPAHRWHLLDGNRLDRAIDATARFLGRDPGDVREALQSHLRSLPGDRGDSPWFYLPGSFRDRIATLVDDTEGVELLTCRGLDPSGGRVWLLQGDSALGSGLFTRLCERLGMALRLDPHELQVLLGQHAPRRHLRTMERRYRMRLLLLDPVRMDRLVHGLSRSLDLRGRTTSALALERALTAARRLADRGWRGSTRHDPLTLIGDVEQDLAIALAGEGGDDPNEATGMADRWLGSDPQLPGLVVVSTPGRHYPEPGRAANLIGWMGRLSARYDRRHALALGIDPEGWIGTNRLEGVYEHLLQGVVGRRVRIREPWGWRELAHEARRPVPGLDLRTALDLELQMITEEALSDWRRLAEALRTIGEQPDGPDYGHGRAGACVIDVRNGGILALASTPGFDLRELRRRYEELIDPDLHPGRPLDDHAAWAAQPPGSTIKPAIAIAGFAEGILAPGDSFQSQGYMTRWRGRRLLGDHPPQPRNWTLPEAIEKSSNTYFAHLGERIGPERLASWLRRLGIGRAVALDVAWQRPGLLPSPSTIAADRPGEPQWHRSDTWRLSVGQFCSSSPLQLAALTATIANRGTVLQPWLWHGIADDAVTDRIELAAAAWDEIHSGMERVTGPGGTARWLRLESGVRVAAKTGTAEWGTVASRAAGRSPNHAWLIAYAPAEDPEVALAIYIHAAGASGGRACSGVAKRILDRWVELRAARILQ